MNNHQQLERIMNDLAELEGHSFEIDRQAIAAVYQKDDDQSLAIKILSVLGGILAGLAFFGFVALTGLLNSHHSMVISGVISVMMTFIINKVFGSILFTTLSVTFYIVGYILLTLGLLEMQISNQIVSMIILVTGLLSLFAIRNYLLSFLSVLIIHFSILSLFFDQHDFEIISLYSSALILFLSYFILNEAKLITTYKHWMSLYQPMRIGLVISFLTILILYSRASFFEIPVQYIWPSSIVTLFSLIFLLSKVFYVMNIGEIKHRALIYFMSLCLLVPLLWSPAILGAILILLLSFYVNHKTGVVIGIMSLIFFIAQYYYDLNLDLLTKSILLMLSGLLFMILYFLSYKKWGHHYA